MKIWFIYWFHFCILTTMSYFNISIIQLTNVYCQGNMDIELLWRCRKVQGAQAIMDHQTNTSPKSSIVCTDALSSFTVTCVLHPRTPTVQPSALITLQHINICCNTTFKTTPYSQTLHTYPQSISKSG